ncbi:hypothetical protein LOTGIDRAFT_181525 [Lottia gigantea]|uniref:RNA ligase 1 n=1 Tax=Lottia gigantea TaxID=225164 RepID=V4A132_LOTGI|nr:hypothetical protein LOTGIDRAFT_181525 [Lottia gigantea]ESO97528.1 hypothetical protein LOTGIDRAFT_181525 [Lottia gigantea]
MEKLLPVQHKISCIFEICVQNEPSEKRSHQPYKVLAGDKLNPKLKDGELNGALITEKLDGTCVLIQQYEGKPWLWARLDRKPNKNADKRFKKFQSQHQFTENTVEEDKPRFNWNVSKDFKEVPDNWIPAGGVEIKDGEALPDHIGHTPGWVPVDVKFRQHCWHLTSVDLQTGIAVVLRESESSGELVIDCVPLKTLEGKTAELIGTMINGNPYKLGTKQFPVHLLVVHGSLRLEGLPQLDRRELEEWFQCNENGKIEGIVWHCLSGSLYKLHRNHLGLNWPVDNLLLSQKPVTISNNFNQYELSDGDKKSQFQYFASICGKRCGKLENIHSLLQDIS